MKRVLISNGNPLEDIIGFSRAVKVGPYITVGGTAPVDENGKTVGIGDVKTQTRQCIEIIKAALEQAGSGLNDVPADKYKNQYIQYNHISHVLLSCTYQIDILSLFYHDLKSYQVLCLYLVENVQALR